MSEEWQVHNRESLAWMREQPPGTFDAVITDPPYSSGGQFRGDRVGSTEKKYGGTEHAGQHDEFGGDTRDQRGYMLWTSIWVSEAMRVCRVGAPFAAFTDWRQLAATIDAVQAGGAVFRGVFVWDKTEGVRPVLGRPRAQCEFVVWGSFGPWLPAGPVIPGCITESVGQKHHRTGKPVRVMRALVRMAPPGALVLDPFCGSGSTGVACINEGRRFVGVEQVASIAETARARLAGTLRDDPAQVPLFSA